MPTIAPNGVSGGGTGGDASPLEQEDGLQFGEFRLTDAKARDLNKSLPECWCLVLVESELPASGTSRKGDARSRAAPPERKAADSRAPGSAKRGRGRGRGRGAAGKPEKEEKAEKMEKPVEKAPAPPPPPPADVKAKAKGKTAAKPEPEQSLRRSNRERKPPVQFSPSHDKRKGAKGAEPESPKKKRGKEPSTNKDSRVTRSSARKVREVVSSEEEEDDESAEPSPPASTRRGRASGKGSSGLDKRKAAKDSDDSPPKKKPKVPPSAKKDARGSRSSAKRKKNEMDDDEEQGAEPPRSTAASSTGAPADADGFQPLSGEERNALQAQIDLLDDGQFDRLIAFLQPNLGDTDDTEQLQLDLDSMPPQRQRALLEFVQSELRHPTAGSDAGGPAPEAGASGAPGPVDADNPADAVLFPTYEPGATPLVSTPATPLSEAEGSYRRQQAWEAAAAREAQRLTQLQEVREAVSAGNTPLGTPLVAEPSVPDLSLPHAAAADDSMADNGIGESEAAGSDARMEAYSW